MKLKKSVSLLLSLIIMIQACYVSMILPSTLKSLGDDTSTTYKNPYVITVPETASTRPTGKDVTIEFENNVFKADTKEKLEQFANYSQFHDCKEITLTLTSATAYDLGSDFVGIGSEQYKFNGTIMGDRVKNTAAQIRLTNCPALCNYLTSDATINMVEITANNSYSGLAENFEITGNESKITNFKVTGTINNTVGTDAGLLFGKVTSANTTNNFNITLTKDEGNMKDFSVTATNGNAGLLIGNIENSNIGINFSTIIKQNETSTDITSTDITFTDITITAKNGNAGLLVGNISDNSSFTTTSNITIIESDTSKDKAITAYRYMSTTDNNSGNAGCIAGYVGNNSKIDVKNISITGSKFKITVGGGKYIGGLFGYTNNSNITLGTLNMEYSKIDGGVYSGGITGYSDNTKNNFTLSNDLTADFLPTQDTTFGEVYVGGLYGVLSINEDYTLQCTNVTTNLSQQTDDAHNTENAINFGGLIGKYDVNNAQYTLEITKSSSNECPQISSKLYIDDKNKIKHYGGIIADISENLFCNINNCKATTDSNVANGDLYVSHFGGAVAFLNEGSFAKITNFTATGNTRVNNVQHIDGYSGGIIGYLSDKSVLELSGNIDVSSQTTSTEENHSKYTGNIVAYQNSSLVFKDSDATIKTNSNNHIDDIGNYGQVINNKTSVITVDDNKNISISKLSLLADNKQINIASPKDYQALAITLNSKGVFSAFNTINSNNYNNLLTKTINFTSDIDLTGCGIECLTRNFDDDDIELDVFSGTVNGENKNEENKNGKNYTITLDIQNVYGHKYLGMFTSVKDVTVNNLTIGGAVTFGTFNENNVTNNNQLYFGGFSAKSNNELTLENIITNVSVKTKIYNGNTSFKNSYYGGVIGHANNTKITSNSLTGNANFTTDKSLSKTILGGIIGHIGYPQKTATISFTNTNLTGKIEINNNTNNSKIGGLVGVIESNDNHNIPNAFKITIKNITTSQTIDYIDSNSSDKYAGGILGSEWKNADILITSDTQYNQINGTIKGATSTMSGGMFYELSGRLSLEKSDINISASDNQRSDYKGMVAYLGTYLYMTVDSTNVTVQSKDKYDDFIGKNRYENGTEKYNNGGILNIETGSTEIGRISNDILWKSDSTNNPNTRYYYNINKLTKENNNAHLKNIQAGTISNAGDLLLWNLTNYTYYNCYTADDSPYCFAYYYLTDFQPTHKNPTPENPISKNFSITTDLNMTDKCLYPTTITDGTFDFKNHTLTFGLTDTTTAKQSEITSHQYQLQTGLFYKVTGNLTVNDLTLSGTVYNWYGSGKNYNSGALITNQISGNKNSDTVTLATLNLNEIKLNNLFVDNATDASYAPLLINKIPTCVTANITGLTQSGYTDNTKNYAATSLIGNVGTEGKSNGVDIATSTNLKLTFSKIILNGKNTDTDTDTYTKSKYPRNSIFKNASLLNSFIYANDGTSRGIYNFNMNEDWDNDNSHIYNVTYGKELYTKETEYYDNDYFVNPLNKPTKRTSVSDVFKSDNFIPYVSQEYITNNSKPEYYHELDVNIKLGDLNEGCGTYDNPYIITLPTQIKTIQTVISDGYIPENVRINFPTKIDGNKDLPTIPEDYNYKTPIYTITGTGDTTKIAQYQNYLSHAYYKIDNDITVTDENFAGFGAFGKVGDYPFAGVIIGEQKDNKNPVITIPEKSNISAFGFVNVAMGCVIKNIDIKINNSSISSGNDSYFGGVIGKIIGGDNIIDNVSVNIADGSKITSTNNRCYVGGYVGLHMTGGLIFRNMEGKQGIEIYNTTSTDNLAVNDDNSEGKNYFYYNPYIGRVLDGFAIVDGDEKNIYELNNTEKNYKINTLTGDQNDITDEFINSVYPKKHNIIINNAEGLFVLSAAVNCGAMATGKEDIKPYTGNARSRKSDYSHIGNCGKDDTDYISTKKENEITIENSYPNQNTFLSEKYINTTYTNQFIKSYITGSDNKVSITLKKYQAENNVEYNLAKYKNGFRGIGANFYLNGGSFANSQINLCNINDVAFDGNNQTIKYDINNICYSEDTYKSNYGGLFNVPILYSTCNFKDVTISGNATVARYSFKATGNTFDDMGINPEMNNDKTHNNLAGHINNNSTAGGLIATLTKDENSTVNITNIKLKDFYATSSCVAGGIIGSQANLNTTLTNCSYDNNNISAGFAGGGIIGFIQATKTNTIFSFIPNKNENLNLTNCTVTSLLSTSKSSNPDNNNSSFSAIIGFNKASINIGDESENSKKIIISNLNISNKTNTGKTNDSYFGGAIGFNAVSSIFTYNSKVSNLTVENSNIIGSSEIIKLFEKDKKPTNQAILDQLKKDPDTEKSFINIMTGGIFGGIKHSTKLKNCLVDNCYIISNARSGGISSSNTHYLTYANSSTFENLSVNNCHIFAGKSFPKSNNNEKKQYINAGGITGFDDSNDSVYSNNTVTNTTIATTNDATADFNGCGGIIGMSNINANTGATTIGTRTITKSTVSNCNIMSSVNNGGVVGFANGYLILDTATVTDSNIISYTNTDADTTKTKKTNNGGVFGYNQLDAYLKNITLKNTNIGYVSTSSSNNLCGGITNKCDGNIYGNNILMDYINLGYINDNISNIQNGTSTTTPSDDNSSAYFVNNVKENATVSLLSVSKRYIKSNYSDFLGNTNKTNAVYSAYECNLESGSDTSVKPDRTDIDTDIHGDGVAVSTPTQIFNDIDTTNLKRYSKVDKNKISNLTTDTLSSLKTITKNSSSTIDIPLLNIKSKPSTIIKEYLELLTNNSFNTFDELTQSAKGENNVNISVSSCKYKYDSTNNTIKKDTNSNKGSIKFTYDKISKEMSFDSNQSYDKLDKTSGTFTILTITFRNPVDTNNTGLKDDFLEFTTNIAVYYPQILTVKSSINVKENETYNIKSVINSKTLTENNGEINISNGDTLTAYCEYVFNDVRLDDDWNYEKVINVLNFNDIKDSDTNFPKDTIINIIDLNSDSFKAYQYKLPNDTNEIPFSEFEKISSSNEETKEKLSDNIVPLNKLNSLKDLTDNTYLYDISKISENTDNYGIEKYLIIINFPLNKMQKTGYHLKAGIIPTAGEDRNVKLDDDNTKSENKDAYIGYDKIPITLWPQPTITVDTTSSKSEISQKQNIEAKTNISVRFCESYSTTLKTNLFGTADFYIQSNSGSKIKLPKGTEITINGEKHSVTNDNTYNCLYHLKDEQNKDLNIISKVESVPKDEDNDAYELFEDSINISFDFSNVNSEEMEKIFIKDLNYQLYSDFYLSHDSTHPYSGIKGTYNISLSLATFSSQPELIVNVASESMLHIGINQKDKGIDDTNNGEISFKAILDLSNCSKDIIEKIKNSSIKLTPKLYKKQKTDNGQEYKPIETANISNYITEFNIGNENLIDQNGVKSYNLTDKEITELCDESNNFRKSFSFKMNVNEKITDISDFANYKVVIEAEISTDNNHYTIANNFIYTLARIQSNMIND